jgi:hypothetical protein
MDKQKQSASTKRAPPPAKPESRSRPIAERGIKTAADMAAYMSAMISDVTCGSITPKLCNAACNAGGKLLKAVEMQYKFGTQNGSYKGRLITDDALLLKLGSRGRATVLPTTPGELSQGS